jgi:hypothetical protein
MGRDAVALFVGDMNIQRDEPETAFASVATSLGQADMVFGNLRVDPDQISGFAGCLLVALGAPVRDVFDLENVHSQVSQ